MDLSEPNRRNCLRAERLRPGEDTRVPLNAGFQCGRIVAVLGPSEAEKNLWMLSLAGFHHAHEGRLHLLDYELNYSKDKTAEQTLLDLHQHVAYVTSQEPLLSTMTVRANVMLPHLYHLHESPETAGEVADAWLDKMDYQGERDVLPAHLDPLERQQVLMARALTLEPPIVFLSEPFDLHLTNGWNLLARQLCRLAHEEDRLVVVATQNLLFVTEHADEILFVNRKAARHHIGWQSFATSNEGRRFLEALPVQPQRLM